jgi:hypothetical protein
MRRTCDAFGLAGLNRLSSAGHVVQRVLEHHHLYTTRQRGRLSVTPSAAAGAAAEAGRGDGCAQRVRQMRATDPMPTCTRISAT